MANEPLLNDTVFEGVIYLKGETRYPDHMAEAMSAKKQVIPATSPIFRPHNGETVPAVPIAPAVPDVPPVPPAEAEFQVITIDPNWQVGTEGHPLPAEFPFREDFIEAGYDSVEAVYALNDYTEVNGIGPSRAMTVGEWMGANVVRAEETQ